MKKAESGVRAEPCGLLGHRKGCACDGYSTDPRDYISTKAFEASGTRPNDRRICHPRPRLETVLRGVRRQIEMYLDDGNRDRLSVALATIDLEDI